MKRKRASIFVPVVVVTTFIVLVTILLVLNAKQDRIEKVGEKQAELFYAYQQGINAQHYAESALKLAMQQAAFELTKQTTKCGEYEGHPLWHADGKECYPTNANADYLAKTSSIMNEYLSKYEGAKFPDNNYELMIAGPEGKTTVEGKAKKPITILLGKEITKYVLPEKKAIKPKEHTPKAEDRYYFSQLDERWRSYTINDPALGKMVLGEVGCGPTSLAMVLQKSGIDKTPVDIFKEVAANKGINAEVGIYHGPGIEYILNKYNIPYKWTNSWEEAKTAVASGKWTIASTHGILYSKGCAPNARDIGHIMVLTGTINNNIITKDPAAADGTVYCSSLFITNGGPYWIIQGNREAQDETA